MHPTLPPFASILKLTVLLLLAGWWIPPARAASPEKTTLSFSVTTNVGFGREIFITGNHPDIGNWNPTRGIKLTWNSGDVWTGTAAIASGTSLDYKPVIIPNAYSNLCDAAQWQFLPPGDGNHLVTNVPPRPPAPYPGKRIYYHSGLTNVTLIYSIDGGAFTSTPMTTVGPGRSGGEFLYMVDGIGEAGSMIEFVMSGLAGTNLVYDHAPYPGFGTPPDNNYATDLDALFLQDGQLFNYWPPPSPSPPLIINSNVVSTFSPSPSRTMRIYLPRGYAENTWKRYPVLYMHDGENVFSPGGTFGSWDADLTATREISQGRLRETIIVALNSSGSLRTREYLPPEDSSGGQGFGDAYSKFLVYNVKAKIDEEFRTRPERSQTMTAGSSSGGLITTYLGWHTNVFGGIGAFSPAYLISPNFNNRIANEPRQDLRIYTDMGTVGSPEILLVADYWNVLDHLLRDGYVQNADLYSWMDCGATHNEAAWAARLPTCLRFLLNPWDERNLLALDRVAPELSLPHGPFAVSFTALAGWRYQLEAAEHPDGPWTNQLAEWTETSPWADRQLLDTNAIPSTANKVYRILAR